MISVTQQHVLLIFMHCWKDLSAGNENACESMCNHTDEVVGLIMYKWMAVKLFNLYHTVGKSKQILRLAILTERNTFACISHPWEDF